ncbi:MAG: hypothetical protein R3C26_10560 [Calditrichia bacterium]
MLQAEQYFYRLLEGDPSHNLDQLSTPPKIMALFQKTKVGYLENLNRRLSALEQAVFEPQKPWRSLVFPGWEQWHRGKKTRGAVWGVAGAVVLGGTVRAVLNSRNKKDEYLAETDQFAPSKNMMTTIQPINREHCGNARSLVSGSPSHPRCRFFSEPKTRDRECEYSRATGCGVEAVFASVTKSKLKNGAAMRTIVFDVDETLLDISALSICITSEYLAMPRFGVSGLCRLFSAMTLTALQKYTDFGSVGRHALTMVAARRNIALSEKDVQQISQNMRKLPAHQEVPAALERLKSPVPGWSRSPIPARIWCNRNFFICRIIDYFEKSTVGRWRAPIQTCSGSLRNGGSSTSAPRSNSSWLRL